MSNIAVYGPGPPGPPGGAGGAAGQNGKTEYQLAVESGYFVGTEAEYMESKKGEVTIVPPEAFGAVHVTDITTDTPIYGGIHVTEL